MVGVVGGRGGAYVVAGRHSEGWVDLWPVRRGEGGVLGYGVAGEEERVRLGGGHGEEIVRDVVVDERGGVCYTCGEDGRVRGWRIGEGEGGMEVEEETAKKEKRERKEKRREKKEKRREGGERYKPY